MTSTRWALVTGATAGIGESFTRLLAAKGYNVVLVARDEARLHERASALREKYGVQTFVLPADLATEAGCKAVEDYISTYPIEVLINNVNEV
jgi:short-subunit dehydrogenase